MIEEKQLSFLIVDDEKEITQSISEYLSRYNTSCTCVHDLSSALNFFDKQTFDFVLLDINLPDGTGFEFLEHAQKLNYNGHIIILSGRDSISDKVMGLTKGSDDFLPKPFNFPLLVARIKNLYKAKFSNKNDSIFFHELSLNIINHRAYINDKELKLTSTEFELLHLLISNAQSVLSRQAIGRHLYRNKYAIDDSFDFIYSQVKNLKRKISEYTQVDYLKTIYGVGYVLTAE